MPQAAASPLLGRSARLALGRPLAVKPTRIPHPEHCGFKPYPCARPLHAVIDALLALDVKDVTHVEVTLPSGMMWFVNADREEPGPAQAAAGVTFAVAAALSGRPEDVAIFHRAGLDEHVPRNVHSRP